LAEHLLRRPPGSLRELGLSERLFDVDRPVVTM